MFIIHCPHCGSRAHHEFTYVADASIKRPDTSDMSQDAQTSPRLLSFIFDRLNPKGWHKEIWHHSAGCRKHVCVTRHTVTHEIKDCQRADLSQTGDAQ